MEVLPSASKQYDQVMPPRTYVVCFKRNGWCYPTLLVGILLFCASVASILVYRRYVDTQGLHDGVFALLISMLVLVCMFNCFVSTRRFYTNADPCDMCGMSFCSPYHCVKWNTFTACSCTWAVMFVIILVVLVFGEASRDAQTSGNYFFFSFGTPVAAAVSFVVFITMACLIPALLQNCGTITSPALDAKQQQFRTRADARRLESILNCERERINDGTFDGSDDSSGFDNDYDTEDPRVPPTPNLSQLSSRVTESDAPRGVSRV